MRGKNKKFTIEQNKDIDVDNNYNIYIQGDKVAVSVQEYYKIASCIMYAKENLLSYKERE